MDDNIFEGHDGNNHLEDGSGGSSRRRSYLDDSEASADTVSFHRPDISRLFRTPLSGQSRPFKRRRVGGHEALPEGAAHEFFTTLTDSVIELVLNYLNKRDLTATMGTCRKLYAIGARPRYWSFANIPSKHIAQSGLHSLLDRRIQVLRLNASTIFTDKRVVSGYHTPQSAPVELAYLDAGQVDYTDPSILFHLMERCSKLVGLNLERCDCLDDSICEEIAKNTRLRFLNLSMASGLTAHGLSLILESCQSLEELNVGWTHHTNELLQVVFTSLPARLKKLNLAGTRELELMNDDGVALICQRCPRLEELDLSDAVELTEVSVAVIRELLPRLRVLSLARCHGIDPAEFVTLNSTRLQELNVQGCLAEESVPVLQQRLPSVAVNWSFLSTIAHPTNGLSVTSIWAQRTRDWY